MIRIWQSFSCNNSSSFRLIARFADAATAQATATELTEYFDAQDKLGGYRYQDAALSVLARTYGFDWQDGGAGESGTHALVEGADLIVYNAYCLGLGPGVPAYLADRGAAHIQHESTSDILVSVLFHAPSFDVDLDAIFRRAVDAEGRIAPLRAPWAKRDARGRSAFFHDPGTVGMWFPIHPVDIPRFKAWLADHGIDDAIIRIDEHGDEDRFLAIANARCTACHGMLEYLDPRLHDIETAQLVCRPCGGLYEVATFL